MKRLIFSTIFYKLQESINQPNLLLIHFLRLLMVLN